MVSPIFIRNNVQKSRGWLNSNQSSTVWQVEIQHKGISSRANKATPGKCLKIGRRTTFSSLLAEIPLCASTHPLHPVHDIPLYYWGSRRRDPRLGR